MSEIDLGVPFKEKYGEPMAVSSPESKDDISFPEFTYSGPVELELPDEGVMEIKFCKKSETSSTREDGKHWYECRIQVKSIVEVEGEDDEDEVPPPTRRNNDAEMALDKLAEGLAEMKRHHAEMQKENGNENGGY